MAWRGLKEYHSLEPEMILQLAGAAFHQWQCGTAHGGKVAPKEKESPEVEAHMKCTWWRSRGRETDWTRVCSPAATALINPSPCQTQIAETFAPDLT